MEIAGGVIANAISGLAVWPAKTLMNRINDNKILKKRLGKWHKQLCSDEIAALIKSKKTFPVPIIPGPSELAKFIKESKDIEVSEDVEIPIDAVCWRGLLARQMGETTALKWFEKAGKKVEVGEVGAYENNIAARIKMHNVYEYIFSNVEPHSWGQVTLGRQERVNTRIGDFTILFFKNMKWVHFLPASGEIVVNKYAEVLEDVRTRGHSVKLKSEKNDEFALNGTIMPWYYRDLDQKKYVDYALEQMELYVDHRKGVFAGGVVSRRYEEPVCFEIANLISVLAKKVLEHSTRFEEQNEHPLNEESKKKEKKKYSVGKQLVKVCDLESLADLVEASMEMVREEFEDALDFQTKNEESKELASYVMKFVRTMCSLRKRIIILQWDQEDWDQLHQNAWIAGVENTVEGEEEKINLRNYKDDDFGYEEEEEEEE